MLAEILPRAHQSFWVWFALFPRRSHRNQNAQFWPHAKRSLRAQVLIIWGLVLDSIQITRYRAKLREDRKPPTSLVSGLSSSLGTRPFCVSPLENRVLNFKAANGQKCISASWSNVATQDAVILLNMWQRRKQLISSQKHCHCWRFRMFCGWSLRMLIYRQESGETISKYRETGQKFQ